MCERERKREGERDIMRERFFEEIPNLTFCEEITNITFCENVTNLATHTMVTHQGLPFKEDSSRVT